MYFVCLYRGLAMVIVMVTGNSFSHVEDICIFKGKGKGKDMEMHLNHTARDLSDVILTFNGKTIAEATNVVSMKWDPGLSGIYTERLSLSNLENLTITLRNLSTMDTGMYRAHITTEKGILKTISRDITVSVAPVVEGEFKITMNEEGQNKIFTCGFFSDFGKPPVTFHWNVSKSRSHSITLSDKPPFQCSAVGPAVENCGLNLIAVYKGCNKSETQRHRRSLGDEPSSSYDSSCDDPTNPVPIVVAVLAAITAITTITAITAIVIAVIYKRRSRTPRKQEPPGSDNLVPMNG